MFFNKAPKPTEYPSSLDSLREVLNPYIDLSVFPNKILSIERWDLDTPEEHTKIFTILENGTVEDYQFDISRKRHAVLVSQAEELKNKQ